MEENIIFVNFRGGGGRALALQGLWQLIALTFTGNTCLMSFPFVYVQDFQSLINRLCAKFHILAIFSPSCCLYCLFEQSAAHISFWVRFAICGWIEA